MKIVQVTIHHPVHGLQHSFHGSKGGANFVLGLSPHHGTATPIDVPVNDKNSFLRWLKSFAAEMSLPSSPSSSETVKPPASGEQNVFTAHAGRAIYKNGKPCVRLLKEENVAPVEVDELTQRIVLALNLAEHFNS